MRKILMENKGGWRGLGGRGGVGILIGVWGRSNLMQEQMGER